MSLQKHFTILINRLKSNLKINPKAALRTGVVLGMVGLISVAYFLNFFNVQNLLENFKTISRLQSESLLNKLAQSDSTLLSNLVKNQSLSVSDRRDEAIDCDEQQSLNQAKQCSYVIRTDRGHGSGFAIAEHYLVTNKHVIEEAQEITTWVNGEELELDLWNFDLVVDLAVLYTDKSLQTCSWADSDEIALAQTLYAIGWPNSPDGESSITKGIFSRNIQTEQGPIFIQTDTAINPGNSGGPLVNSCGVVGINTAKIAWSGEDIPAEGFSFAITSNYAFDIVNELIANGQVQSLPVADLGEIKYAFDKHQTEPPGSSSPEASQKIVISEASKQDWMQARDATNEMEQYWLNHGTDVNASKLAVLKDLIVRMQTVIEVVVPKILSDQLLSSAEEQLLQDWNSMYQKAVVLEGELHGRDYFQGYAHYQCQNNACTLIAGRGKDGCDSGTDCAPSFHYGCRDLTCTVIEGEGENECTSHDDCYHYTCEGQQCLKVAGSGIDECYFDWQCQ